MRMKNRLDLLMAKRNLTCEALAERSGVSALAIEFLRRGKAYPKAHAARKIARALEVDIQEIWPELTSREYQTFRTHKIKR